MPLKYIALLNLIAGVLISSCNGPETRFVLLEPDETGIQFSNTITESDTNNILANEHIYNGGGVGIADFNNDELPDVYLTGNMVPNKLYLNRGDFKFEDVTDLAGTGLPDRWSSGVSVVDINSDGLLDIYVCATNQKNLTMRTNALLVNQGIREGIPIFKDMASAYGVADTTYTTTSAFFDYDNDGDLDLFLVVDVLDKKNSPNEYRKKIIDGKSPLTDRLYRNDWSEELGHPVFTDVSKEAGILYEGYSLGLNIADFNQDGWKDVYISNDYISNDLLYINNQDGTFTNRASDYFKHTSHSAMGNDVVDVNNDGQLDIVVLDMLPEDNYRKKTMMPPTNYMAYFNNERYGYDYQYVRNTLQLNQGRTPSGDIVFSEVGMLAGIHATDWSWAPLVADFDNDGDRDLIVTNGFPKDITDRDFMDYHSSSHRYASDEFLLSQIPSVKIKNYAFQKGEGLTFEDVTEAWGISLPSFSNGAAYADLDNDGDLDYLVNNIDDPAFVFKNYTNEKSSGTDHWLRVKLQGPENNSLGLGAEIRIEYGEGKFQMWEHTIYRGYLSSVEPVAHFGLGASPTIDRLTVVWPNRKMQTLENLSADQEIQLKIDDATGHYKPGEISRAPLFEDITASSDIDYKHEEEDYIDFNVQRLLPHKLSQYGPGNAAGDVNGDGLDDFYVSGSHFYKGRFFLQLGDGKFEKTDLLPGAEGESKRQEELGALLFDAEGDNDLDLYLVSGGYEFAIEDSAYLDRLFLNDGNGNFTLGKDALPELYSSGSCVKAADYDRDGDLDLFIGGRVMPGKYPVPVGSYLLCNDSENGRAKFSIDERITVLDDLGLVSDALWTDFDNDGWTDLIIAGEWMPITFLKNNQGEFQDITESSGVADRLGWWSSIVSGDFDKDGDMDYILGNLGLNTIYKGSKEHPVRIYAADFDDNGALDAVPSIYFPDVDGTKKEFPFFGRIDMEKQIIELKGKFRFHADFAKATIEEVIPKEKVGDVLTLEANHMESSYLENLGSGKFALSALPIEAQIAPVYGMVTGDFNGDSHLDVLLTGNDYGTEVLTGRYDAFTGLILAGNGNGEFSPLSMRESGVNISGDAKGLIKLNTGNNSYLLIASQNNGPLRLLNPANKPGKVVLLEPDDFYAILQTNDGDTYKKEFYYGHTYLSQSSRVLYLSENIESVEIYDFQGDKRVITHLNL